MKITQKLIIAFSVLILIFIGEIILNQIITSHANDTYDKLMNKINPTIKTLAKYESINKRLNLLTNTRINGDEKIVTVNRFTRVLEIELRHIKKELYLLRDDALNITINKILVDKIINKTNQLINYSLKIDHLLKNKNDYKQNLESEKQILNIQIQSLYLTLDRDINQLYSNYNKSFQKYNSELSNNLKSFSKIILFTGVIGIIIGLAITIQVTFSISNQINNFKNAAISVSKGDLDKKIPVKGKNEFSELGTLFNKMSSELKKSFTKQENQIDKIKSMNKELEQFVYVASHDLQEPLRTVASYLGLIRELYNKQLDDTALKYMEHVENASERMKMLIKNLLDYSRIGDEKKIEIVDCNELVHNILLDFELIITENNASVKIDKLPKINGLKIELKQLFQNLISNGLKFRKKDSNPKIHIKVESRKNDWLFSVKDNGIGVDAKHYERVFIIFQRLNNRETYKGTGIGLAICKKIVEMHKGKIWIESELNVGTTFYFTIHKNLKTYEKI